MLAVLGRDRGQWLAIAAMVAAFNGMSSRLIGSLEGKGLIGAIADTGGISPIFWFTLAVAVSIAFERDGSDSTACAARRLDWLAIGAVFALALVPVVSAGSAGVLLAGLWMVWHGAPGSRERRSGYVYLALTTTLIWAHFALIFLGPSIVDLDGRFVAWMAGTGAQGNLVSFSDGGGKPMMITYGCSSMHNITMALQFWVAVTQMLRVPFGMRSLLVAILAVIANILVNGLRLTTLAHNQAEFDYWHTGGGGTLFAWAAVFTVVITVTWGSHALAPRRL